MNESRTGRRAVYTALTGSYEVLTEQPVAASSELDFICFTDDPTLRSDSWDVRLVEPILPLDPVRSARALKIGGHPDLAGYEETLWIDARVRLLAEPGEILDEWLADVDLAVPRHSFRKNVVAEFEELLIHGLDDFARLYEQLTHYTALAPARLEEPVPWTAIMARRRTPEVEGAMAEWLLHVLRYSRRDQLSFVEAVARAGAGHRLVELDNDLSSRHEWLPGQGRSTRPSIFRMSESLQPPTAALGELQRRLENTTRELSGAVGRREEALRGAEGRIAALSERNAALQERNAVLRERLGTARGRIDRLRDAKARLEAESAAGPLRRSIRRLRAKLRR